ncbi:hypothetical protein ACA910_006139 [Epithemia clementina (nom. ined.)]
MFTKLRLLRQDGVEGGLAAIKIPDPDDNTKWKLVIEQDQITQCLIHRNNAHFGQANGMPFTEQPLLNTIGRNAEHGLTSILAALQQEHNSDATNALLQHLHDYTLPQVSCSFSGEELKRSFKVWREATSTSPHGTHLGLYKALVTNDPAENHTASLDHPPLPAHSTTPTSCSTAIPQSKYNTSSQSTGYQSNSAPNTQKQSNL